MGNSNNKKVTNMKNSSSGTNKTNSIDKSKVVKKTKKKSEAGRIVFLLFIVVLFIVILISTVFSDVMRIISNKKETEELSNRYVELQEEEKSLKSEVFKLQDPEYIERYAREKYLLTSEGEKILIYVEDGKTPVNSDKKDESPEEDNTNKKDSAE